MTAQKGRNVLLKVSTDGVNYNAIGGARTITWTIANTPVDITNADSAGIRQLLEGAGVNSTSIKCQGVFVDTATDATLNTGAMTNQHLFYQLVWPGPTTGGTLSGKMMIASAERTGAYNEGAAYNITLESADAMTYTQ